MKTLNGLDGKVFEKPNREELKAEGNVSGVNTSGLKIFFLSIKRSSGEKRIKKGESGKFIIE